MSSKLKRRLEVAAEFRNLGETGSAAEILDKPIRYQMGFQAIKAVLGKGDCFELLADLIEPDARHSNRDSCHQSSAGCCREES